MTKILFQRLVASLVSSAVVWKTSNAFVVVAPASSNSRNLAIRTASQDATATTLEPPPSSVNKKKEIGLLTFDLDDTLYPIATVVKDANDAFVKAMDRFGFEGVDAFDMIKTGKLVRAEIASEDPEKAFALTHTEVREMAIRREMEKIIYNRKLEECAEDWATPVSDLTEIVKKPAREWAKAAVSESIVQQVLTSWEMERHHSAERQLFPGVVDALKQIKKEHPNVIIGAVTDGRANPLLMTFTLAPYFDFCLSWEDDQSGRQKFFRDLNNVETIPDLTWIYEAARHKYALLKEAQIGITNAKKKGADKEDIAPLVWPDSYDDLAYVHVGDDLAFDVGGSAACGAKPILVELPKSLGQTAPFRFKKGASQPDWSTTPTEELEARIKMNDKAKNKFCVEINSMERLPVAINQILRGDV